MVHRDPGSTVVVDLSDLSMDSSGINVMVQAKTKLRDAFVLTRPQPNVVLEITGLTDLIVDWDPAWSE
jgi:anti-anti-sigma factor